MDYTYLHLRVPRELHTELKIAAMKAGSSLESFSILKLQQAIDPKAKQEAASGGNAIKIRKADLKSKAKVEVDLKKSQPIPDDGICKHNREPGMCPSPICVNSANPPV